MRWAGLLLASTRLLPNCNGLPALVVDTHHVGLRQILFSVDDRGRNLPFQNLRVDWLKTGQFT